MDPAFLAKTDADTIGALLGSEGLDPSYRAFVARHLTEPDSRWRWCCGSQCDPCVERLGRVVDAARTALGIGPEGLPVAPGDQ